MPTTDRKRGRINLNADERRDISIQFRVNKAGNIRC